MSDKHQGNQLTPLVYNEFEAILKAIARVSRHAERDALFLKVLNATGANIGALSRLTQTQVGPSSVVFLKPNVAEDDIERWILYSTPEELCAEIQAYCRKNNITGKQFVFTGSRDAGPIKRWYIWWVVKKAAKVAGVRHFNKVGAFEAISPVSIRTVAKATAKRVIV